MRTSIHHDGATSIPPHIAAIATKGKVWVEARVGFEGYQGPVVSYTHRIRYRLLRIRAVLQNPSAGKGETGTRGC